MRTFVSALAVIALAAGTSYGAFSFSVTHVPGVDGTAVLVVDQDGDGLNGTDYVTDDTFALADTYQWDEDDSLQAVEAVSDGAFFQVGVENVDLPEGLDWYVLVFENGGDTSAPGADVPYVVYGDGAPGVASFSGPTPPSGSASIVINPAQPSNLETVPEPASAMLIGLGGLALLARRRRA